MNNISKISLDEFKKGSLRGSSTLERTKEIAETFLTCSIRGLIAEKMNNDVAAQSVLDIIRNQRFREDRRCQVNAKHLNAFSEFSQMFGEDELDLMIDDAASLALIGGQACDERYDPNYQADDEQDTPDYRRSLKDLHDKALPFFHLPVSDLFDYVGRLSPKIKDHYETWLKPEDDEYQRINHAKATIAYVLDKASDPACSISQEYPNHLFLFGTPTHHPRAPYEYKDYEQDYESPCTQADKITAYNRINLIMNMALRLVWKNMNVPIGSIEALEQRPHDHKAGNTDKGGLGEIMYEIDGCAYIGDPRNYHNSGKSNAKV